jgi:hypothetical protein
MDRNNGQAYFQDDSYTPPIAAQEARAAHPVAQWADPFNFLLIFMLFLFSSYVFFLFYFIFTFSKKV